MSKLEHEYGEKIGWIVGTLIRYAVIVGLFIWAVCKLSQKG